MEAAGEHRNATTSATSSGVMRRPAGTISVNVWMMFSPPPIEAKWFNASVSTTPGDTALTLTPREINSTPR